MANKWMMMMMMMMMMIDQEPITNSAQLKKM